jgi:hypothetical protein
MLSRRQWFASLAVLAVVVVTTAVSASPMITSAVVNPRIFNDDTDSTFTFTNNYPSLISLSDSAVDGDGTGGEWANRHNFRLSENSFTAAVFNNGDAFQLFADVTITGTAPAEGGLNVAPWWSQDVDGVVMVNSSTGEIAAFGGRLPFYSFNSHVPAVTYTKGETVRLGVQYAPRGLSDVEPAIIKYSVLQGGTLYESPWLSFDEGNAAEGKGTWGMLDDARVGGYFQVPIAAGDPTNEATITFENLAYAPIPEPVTLVLLAAGGVVLARRRR